jgi:hypothetical protein
MAINITQQPATASLAQSPMIFTVNETTNVKYSSSFQYVADLYYWTGSLNQSGSIPKYTLVKYPNDSLVGIFDTSRIVNSTLTDLAIQNTSNVVYYACDFYWQYQSGNTYVTGSHTKSNSFKALDGYGIFPEPIGQQIPSKSLYWPIMTDGPNEQEYFNFNLGKMGVYVGTAGSVSPTIVRYTSYAPGTNTVLSTVNYSLPVSSVSSSAQITQIPIGPLENGFPLGPTPSIDFTIQARTAEYALGAPIRFNFTCKQKYPNVRLKWKNRYGQFDYFNFYMVNRQSFQTMTRTYQPQLGSWQGQTLSYNDYDSSTLNYISDSKQTLTVNTNWISQDYNDILKQLLVSDEIYWYYEEDQNEESSVSPETVDGLKPITIKTNSILFKTGVNDNVIQYQFDFDFGQAYKLLL